MWFGYVGYPLRDVNIFGNVLFVATMSGVGDLVLLIWYGADWKLLAKRACS